MKAVILNSGMGKRMGEHTATRPKCLLEIGGGDTILSRQVRQLLSVGIASFLITTGPFAEKVEEHLERLYPGLRVEFVNNPRHETTNYIYSLLLAGELLDEEILLLHGDLVFEDRVLQKLLHSPHEHAVLVNRVVDLPEKDFKGRLEGGLVKKIAVDIFDPGCVALIPMYRLSREGMKIWLEEMGQFAKAGRLNVYAEDALNNLLNKIQLYPVFFEREFCMEIDTPEDLELARSMLAGSQGYECFPPPRFSGRRPPGEE